MTFEQANKQLAAIAANQGGFPGAAFYVQYEKFTYPQPGSADSSIRHG